MRMRWRGMELPIRVICNEETLTECFGEFTAEPFERGFGSTVGNSFRRILLSSLEGAAVTALRIDGVQHEFSTIPGVKEDVPEIILNIKQLRLSMERDEETVLRIDAKRKGVVTGGDVQTESGVEVANKDHVIATINDSGSLNIEMTARKGRGYIPSEDHDLDPAIGLIPVDSFYSSVRRVEYRVEDTRVGRKTNYDKLILRIWTDGTVSPELALVEAAEIMRKHLIPFVHYFDLGNEVQNIDKFVHEGPTDEQVELRKKFDMNVVELDLSVRACNCLESAKIQIVGDLIQKSPGELLKVRNFGKTSLKEVDKRLGALGLSLGMKDQVQEIMRATQKEEG
jgi:DNA-directed RNA polymerase subunit alpha